MYTKFYREFYPKWMPSRVVICIMMFTCTWTSYMLRLQMPILAVPMIRTSDTKVVGTGVCVGQSTSDRRSGLNFVDLETHIQDMLPTSINDTDVRAIRPSNTIALFSGLPFDWSPDVRGQLIAAYSYGNVPGNFVGGLLALKFGPRRAVLWTSLVAAVISLVTPILAQVHWSALLMSRVIIGFTGGITFPACHTMVAKWAPPNEKARFIWSLLGGTFGTIFTYPMVAGLAESINWEAGWYIPSILMLFWIVLWMFLAWDSPEEHPGITEEEKEYILTSQEGSVRHESPSLKETPMLKIFTSIPFISLILCHFGNLFLLFFYQNSMMLYLTKALGFQLTKGGFLASLPWAARMLFGFVFSWAGDAIQQKQLMSITLLRKSATIFSHLIPGICLIVVGYLGCSFLWANVFLFLTLGFNGAASISNLSNNQDLSPNFAGFLYGIMNTISCTSGMIIPPMVEAIAGRYGNPIDRWQIVFWICAAVCILCMIVFCLGGSGEIQSWNEIKPKDSRDAEKSEGSSKKHVVTNVRK